MSKSSLVTSQVTLGHGVYQPQQTKMTNLICFTSFRVPIFVPECIKLYMFKRHECGSEIVCGIRGPTGGGRREETKAREMENKLNMQYMLVGKLPSTTDGANIPKKNI